MHTRQWMFGGVVLAGVLALLVWRARGPDSPAAAHVKPQASGAPARPQVAPALPRPGAGLRIRGTVVDLHGRPVAGARVSASWPEPGQTLSELPCPEGSFRSHEQDPRDPSASNTKLPECMRGAAPLVLELVAARQGEAPVYAEATSTADGTFTLEALPEGPLTLRALATEGAAMRSGIPAGTEGVELVLGEGMTLKGTVSGDGEPLPGASVTVLDAGHTRFFDTRTGADGRFRIGPLPSSGYFVFIAKEGWHPQLVDARAPLEVSLFRPGQLTGRVVSGGAPVPGVRVHAAPGEDLPGIAAHVATTDAQGRFTFALPATPHTLSAGHEGRYAVARAEPGAPPPEVVLELGSAMHAEGTVRDDAGHPVAGVQVSLMQTLLPGTALETVTGADGHYRAGPVEPGTWLFTLKAARHVDLAEELLLTGEDWGPRDFTLPRAATVSGRATTPEGRPLPGVQFLFLKPAPGEDDPDLAELVEQTWTDAEGRFTVDAEAPGDYVLRTLGPTVPDQTQAVRAPSEDVRFILRPGAAVAGTVEDARGLPLEGFGVKLYPREDGTWAEWWGSSTDAHGRFLIQGAEPGHYMLVATLQTASLERLVWREVQLSEGVTSEVALRLGPERTVSGIVVDDSGRPVEGASVRARLPQEGAPRWRWEGVRDRHGPPLGWRTGPDGRFTLRHLTEATYDVRALKAGYRFVPGLSVGGQPQGRTALRTGPDTSELRLVLEREPHLTGRLVGPDGAPLPRFTLNERPFETATDGTFTIPFYPPEGSEPLIFGARGMAPVVLGIRWREHGADVDLGVVRMAPGRPLRGRVLDARTSAPVLKAAVTLVAPPLDPGGVHLGISYTVLTEEDGSFALDHVNTRGLLLSVSAPGRYVEQRVPLAEAQETLTVRLDPGAEVVVTTGPPHVPGTQVFFRNDDVAMVSGELEEGRRVQRGLPPGTYEVSLGIGDSDIIIYCSQRMQVPAHGRVTVDFNEEVCGSK